jgi:hypothetical protein
MSMPLLRFILLLTALSVAAVLIAVHGVRAIAAIVVLLLAVSVPKTRVWRAVERRLVRIAGSRRRAAVLVALLVIGIAVAVNVYEFIG